MKFALTGDMKFALAGLLLCLPSVVCLAQTPLRAGGDDTPASALQLSSGERAFFHLGYQLGRAAFAYAELAKGAAEVARDPDKLAQVRRLAALAPTADRDREDARYGFARALSLLDTLDAPDAAQAPVRRAAARLGRPLALAGDARQVGLFSARAGRTLGCLDEFSALSSLPEDAALRHWLDAAPSGQVWYAEGLIASLAETASSRQMPELLPAAAEIATDLRGLRDWLSGRLPDPPTADQAALVSALDAFLSQTSRTGRPQATPLSPAQLQSLGDISRRLQAQVLGEPGPAPDPRPPTPPAG